MKSSSDPSSVVASENDSSKESEEYKSSEDNDPNPFKVRSLKVNDHIRKEANVNDGDKEFY